MTTVAGLRVQARCSGCGAYSTARRAITCCGGRCQDESGRSCNSLACPGCGRHHYWSGSFKLPARNATVFGADGERVSTDDVYPYAELREYLRLNKQVAASYGAASAIRHALKRLRSQHRPAPAWLVQQLERALARAEPLTHDLVAYRDQLRPAVEAWYQIRSDAAPGPRLPRPRPTAEPEARP